MIGSLSLQDLAVHINAECVPHGVNMADIKFTRVCTDSRQLLAGDLFVALVGERFDGHAFVEQAARSGAIAAVVTRVQNVDLPQLRVPDTTAALGWLGYINRQRSAATVVAVTGSQGKTTVKELTAAILRQQFNVLVTEGNLNNTIGVPLTLLCMSPEHEKAVIELGANAAGEIAWTARITNPHVVLINNAAETHLEGFGSLQGVVRAKGEIIDCGADTHTVILNADDANVAAWVERAGQRQVKLFSVAGKASKPVDYYATDIIAGARGVDFVLHTPVGAADCVMSLPGLHNVANALAACALAMEAGASLVAVVQALAAVKPVRGRLCPVSGAAGARILDDSYNASPSSFRAAIDVMVESAADDSARTVLVMGDMAELGDFAVQAHHDVGVYARSRNVASLYAVGDLSRHAVAGFGSGAIHFADKQTLVEHLRPQLSAATVILVKGSRSSAMEEITQQLKSGENN